MAPPSDHPPPPPELRDDVLRYLEETGLVTFAANTGILEQWKVCSTQPEEAAKNPSTNHRDALQHHEGKEQPSNPYPNLKQNRRSRARAVQPLRSLTSGLVPEADLLARESLRGGDDPPPPLQQQRSKVVVGECSGSRMCPIVREARPKLKPCPPIPAGPGRRSRTRTRARGRGRLRAGKRKAEVVPLEEDEEEQEEEGMEEEGGEESHAVAAAATAAVSGRGAGGGGNGNGTGTGSSGTKGLRHFSSKVCEKVESKGRTTYSEVAEELVLELCNREGDEKNIRRRVYDALNVLMAVGMFTKQKKDIFWRGMPDEDGHASQLESLIEQKRRLTARIRQKEAYLQELQRQYIPQQKLIERNRDRPLAFSEDQPHALQLPFLLIKAPASTPAEIRMSSDFQDVYFDFKESPFQIYDDVHTLRFMAEKTIQEPCTMKHHCRTRTMCREFSSAGVVPSEDALPGSPGEGSSQMSTLVHHSGWSKWKVPYDAPHWTPATSNKLLEGSDRQHAKSVRGYERWVMKMVVGSHTMNEEQSLVQP